MVMATNYGFSAPEPGKYVDRHTKVSTELRQTFRLVLTALPYLGAIISRLLT